MSAMSIRTLSLLALSIITIEGVLLMYLRQNTTHNVDIKRNIYHINAPSLLPQNAESERTEKIQNKLYGHLCFAPNLMSRDMTMEKFNKLAGGRFGEWPVVLGSDIGRLHLASQLMGRTLELFDNFNGMCLKIEKAFEFKGDFAIGGYNGFGHRHAAIWKCKPSKDFDGVYRCNIKTNSYNIYSEDLMFYFTDTNRENVFVTVLCYPNGDVGWHSLTNRTILTQEDINAIEIQIQYLGFSKYNTVPMYSSISCNPPRRQQTIGRKRDNSRNSIDK